MTAGNDPYSFEAARWNAERLPPASSANPAGNGGPAHGRLEAIPDLAQIKDEVLRGLLHGGVILIATPTLYFGEALTTGALQCDTRPGCFFDTGKAFVDSVARTEAKWRMFPRKLGTSAADNRACQRPHSRRICISGNNS